MKRFLLMIVLMVFPLGVAAGCSQEETESGAEKEITLHEKHADMPEYVMDASPIVQETYAMAAEHQEVLAAVPCYCNCNETAGHMNNLHCFVKSADADQAVTEWDPHGIA